MNQSLTNSNNFSIEKQKIAFIHASWHVEIVSKCLEGFKEQMIAKGYKAENIDIYAVPGAYEIPLQAKLLAKTGRYDAVAASALVVDGGIYRHDFVAQTVCSGLMQVQLETETPVFTAVLTPHNFHEHEEHENYFKVHFVKKGKELAEACDQTLRNISAIKYN
ncbi:6,7-dimethyl-8-ribityllumazine synthase [Marinomonas agarivorans]|nr:6,7-dimethyl-8-ribityllumazine synthase [Marinomonas agarivorans]